MQPNQSIPRATKGKNEYRKPPEPVVIDQPQTNKDNTKTVELSWAVTFNQKFPVQGLLTQEQFVEMAKEQIAWLKEDFIKRLEEYPQELLKTLNKYDLLDKPTFKG